MADEFDIVVVERADEALVQSVDRLIRQLSSSPSPRTPTLDELRAMLESPSTTLLVARAANSSLIGMLALVVFRIPTGVRAFIEDVVVDREFRGRGVGAALTRRALDPAVSSGARP